MSYHGSTSNSNLGDGDETVPHFENRSEVRAKDAVAFLRDAPSAPYHPVKKNACKSLTMQAFLRLVVMGGLEPPT